jgi:hypothetical protein
MAIIRKKTENIRHFILSNVQQHPEDIIKITADHFKISRQSVNKHMRALIAQADIVSEGNTSSKIYRLGEGRVAYFSLKISEKIEEHKIWNDLVNLLKDLPDNIKTLWAYSFQEILNNAIEHSEGEEISIIVKQKEGSTKITIIDDGVGIFHKLCSVCRLDDEKHAALELSKGKLTTAPDNHTGQGIFFSSRMVDKLTIYSGRATLYHSRENEFDFVFEGKGKNNQNGTIVDMVLENNTSRTVNEIFNMFESPEDEDHGFTKTIIPVKLAQFDQEMMISRSQARRVLSRLNRFKYVALDFKGVDRIGQAFADEIFRVFTSEHPDIKIYPIHENEQINNAIKKAYADARDLKKCL